MSYQLLFRIARIQQRRCSSIGMVIPLLMCSYQYWSSSHCVKVYVQPWPWILWYQLWRKYQPGIAYRRCECISSYQSWARYVLSRIRGLLSGIKKSQTLEYVQVDIGRDHKLFDISGIGPEGKSLFENYLDKYFGLQVCMGSQAENRPMFQATRCGSFFVCAKDE